MRTEQLKYFVEVAKSHSICIAAEKLFVTPSAISVAIKNLETELSCTLFERSKNGMYLTKIGSKVLEQAEKIIEKEDYIHFLTAQDHKLVENELHGELNLVAVPIWTQSFLQKVLLDFYDLNPKVKVKVKEELFYDIYDGIICGKYDIGICMISDEIFQKIMNDQRVCCKKVFAEKIYIVANKIYNLSAKKSLNYEDISQLPLIAPSNDPFNNADICGEEIKHVNVVLETFSLDLIQTFIYSGKAVALLPNSFVNKLEGNSALDIIPVSHLNNGNIYYLYNKNNIKPQIIAAFEKSLVKNY